MRFLSTPSARRATRPLFPPGMPTAISIHALREEGDVQPWLRRCSQQISIHALREEGDEYFKKHPEILDDFYPRPPRGGRRPGWTLGRPQQDISIHALREEGDQPRPQGSGSSEYFYPRPPRGGRHDCLHHRTGTTQFLSTPSARRATFRRTLRQSGRQNFYPRPPRGGRPKRSQGRMRKIKFLSTPSARRATSHSSKPSFSSPNFYPRPPRGGRLSRMTLFAALCTISIHALREEGDYLAPHQKSTGAYFYPRPPRGGRPLHWDKDKRRYIISIHALREEGDNCRKNPHGQEQISIHALREEGDRAGLHHRPQVRGFLSTPSARRATAHGASCWMRHRYFYPRPPRGGRL